MDPLDPMDPEKALNGGYRGPGADQRSTDVSWDLVDVGAEGI